MKFVPSLSKTAYAKFFLAGMAVFFGGDGGFSVATSRPEEFLSLAVSRDLHFFLPGYRLPSAPAPVVVVVEAVAYSELRNSIRRRKNENYDRLM